MHYITSGIIFAVVIVLMKHLTSSSKKQPILNGEGVMVLRMNKNYSIFGYMNIAISAMIGIIPCLGLVETIGDTFIILCLVLFFIGSGTLLVLVSRNTKVEIYDEKIRYYGITGKVKEIQWEDIRKVTFGKTSLELSLITMYEKIKIHMHMVGFLSFIELMKKKIDYSLYEEACDKIGQIYAHLS